MTVDPGEFLKANDVDGALAALQDKVRADPSNAALRIFLFQLLCVTGDWKRAITQLKLSAELDALAVPMAQTYREAIICEVFREKVFSGEKEPLIFGEPQQWVAILIEALKALAQGKAEQAAELRNTAFEMAPAVSGEVDGQRFDWIADADMRLGPVLEIIVNGRYFWMPFNTIDVLKIEEPADLRDSVWTAATLKVSNGGEFVGLIPTRYPGTEMESDGATRLSRATGWVDAGAETFIGLGQRLLTTDQGDLALMDVRHIKMDTAPATQEAAQDG